MWCGVDAMRRYLVCGDILLSIRTSLAPHLTTCKPHWKRPPKRLPIDDWNNRHSSQPWHGSKYSNEVLNFSLPRIPIDGNPSRLPLQDGGGFRCRTGGGGIRCRTGAAVRSERTTPASERRPVRQSRSINYVRSAAERAAEPDRFGVFRTSMKTDRRCDVSVRTDGRASDRATRWFTKYANRK